MIRRAKRNRDNLAGGGLENDFESFMGHVRSNNVTGVSVP